MSTNLSGENVESMEMCLRRAEEKKITFPFSANFETGNGDTICDRTWTVGNVHISDTSGQVV